MSGPKCGLLIDCLQLFVSMPVGIGRICHTSRSLSVLLLVVCVSFATQQSHKQMKQAWKKLTASVSRLTASAYEPPIPPFEL